MEGIFSSIWSMIYHPDTEEDSADELEDILNDLMNRHDVPSKWLGEDVKFAFKEKFIKDKINSELIKDLEFVLNNCGYKLLIDEIQVKDADIVWQDENQIVFVVK